MGRFWKRLLGRHVNALSFWAVLVLVALSMVFAAALIRGEFGPKPSPPAYSSPESSP